MIKLDLHTHSIASSDGGITKHEYEEIIAKRILDVVAITDHGRIDFAQKLHKKLGEKIIVGQEIATKEGEVIGLFLTKPIEEGLSTSDTIKAIHKQRGLVYVPHPFDSLRKGVGEKVLLQYFQHIDIIEGFNGRMIFRWQNKKALEFGEKHSMIVGVGSDAHNKSGLGRTYAMVDGLVSQKTLKEQLQSATISKKYQPLSGYLGPKWNRIRAMLSSRTK